MGKDSPKNKFKCRTGELREKIVKKYELTPVQYTKLLNGQSVTSCAGPDLTDSYYLFEYRARESSEEGTFYCGKDSAEHFLELCNLKKLPLFDPLKKNPSDSNPDDNITDDPANNNHAPNIQWNIVAKQLYDAINIVLIVWGYRPNSPLRSIKERVRRNKSRAPNTSDIYSVNRIVGKDNGSRTVSMMIKELSKKNNIRDFKFDRLNEILAESDIPSHF